ncbi:MAG: hypothetical protein JXL97_04165 [Bacteroidales bacterium]|nr:hypothetical protein [Bacteroidales bacterium]
MIEERRIKYNSYSKDDYNNLFFNNETGGFVVAHKKHGILELPQNLFIAKLLANMGEIVVLLEETPHFKSPDAERNGLFWEFKTISKAKNISRAIENSIRSAKKQAQNVLNYD